MRRWMIWNAAAILGVLVSVPLFAQSDLTLDLAQSICLYPAHAKVGEPVAIRYTVQNKSTQPITLSFRSGQQFDIWITHAGKECFRHSRGRSYTQMLTNIVLQPCETRTFDVTWNQKDLSSKDCGPGVYQVFAQLTTSGTRPAKATAKLQIGTYTAAVSPVTISEAIRDFSVIGDRTVQISATYRGWQPNQSDENVKDGPPVTRSDWAICDKTGCIYVTGGSDLNPERDLGAKVVVTGKLKRTEKGQIYLQLQQAKTVK